MKMSQEDRVVVVAIRMERKSVVVAVAIAVLDTKWIRIGSVSTIHVAAITAVLVVSTVVWTVVVTSSEYFLKVLLKQTSCMRPDPNAPVTMSNHPPTSESFEGLAGVGTLGNRHYVPAVFYSDLNNTAAGTKTPLYIIPADIPNQQTLFSTTMAPVVPISSVTAPQESSSKSCNM
ncbi:hypothetical protein WA171_004586 [Blastocystis sp. BT1]